MTSHGELQEEGSRNRTAAGESILEANLQSYLGSSNASKAGDKKYLVEVLILIIKY
jgi:hypothetical protein